MKKAKKLCLIFGIVLLFVSASIFAFFYFGGVRVAVAPCIVSENGSLFMEYYGRPVRLNGNFRGEFETGDKILVLCQSAFAESYPEQTRAHFVFCLSKGTETVSQRVLDSLSELGYLGERGNLPLEKGEF